MAISHTNRKGKTYYLHEGKTKTGKPRWFFSMKTEGTLTEAIPEGYEIYEEPNAQVFLRKIVARRISDAEIHAVREGVRRFGDVSNFIVDVKDDSVVVFLPSQSREDRGPIVETLMGIPGSFGFERLSPGLSRVLDTLESNDTYIPMMRFTLQDEEKRTFSVERWCFRGAIDGWFYLRGGSLNELVAKYCCHLGRESFFDLM